MHYAQAPVPLQKSKTLIQFTNITFYIRSLAHLNLVD